VTDEISNDSPGLVPNDCSGGDRQDEILAPLAVLEISAPVRPLLGGMVRVTPVAKERSHPLVDFDDHTSPVAA
jgi:hypothetical protein